MPQSYLDQELQIRSSVVYNDAIASPHTIGVAEGQTTIEGDLNVLRTLVKDFLGLTTWYDTPTLSLEGISGKYFIDLIQQSGFIDVASGTGLTSTAFSTAIKTITGHNDGGGNSTTEGVVLNSTKDHRLAIRNHDTQNAIDDGSGNEVYGRLSYVSTAYTLTWYSMVNGTETAYNFTASVDLDLACVLVSRQYASLSWDRFIDPSFHDMAGFTGSIADDNVVVDGMLYFLNTLVTQAQVNARVDKLGHTDTSGEGANYVAIDDTATGSNGYWTGSYVQAVINEIKTQIGGATSTTYDFTGGTGSVLSDNDVIYAALNKLDQGWVNLIATTVGNGATLVGIYDAGGYTTETTVEGALQEIYGLIQNIDTVKIQYTVSGSPIASGTPWTLPGSLTYTPDAGGNGANLDVYLNGAIQMAGAGNDYLEVAGAPSTQITWNKTVPIGRNIVLVARQ